MDTVEEEEASDAGAPGPGAPVADLSAMDRRTEYDDTAFAPGLETAQVTDLPLCGYIRCRFCAGEGPETCFMHEGQLMKHLDERHPRQKAVWRCAACHKSFEKLHGWRCHRPHCPGAVLEEETEGDGGSKCTICDRTFRTQRGLAQHERHQHPSARNLKRIEQCEGGGNRPSNRASAWSKEEVDLLITLDRRFRGERYPNVKIREFLPHKTCKQISDKRRLLPAGGRSRNRAEEEYADEGSSGSSVYETATEEIQEAPRQSIGRERWEDPLRRYIIANDLEDRHPLRTVERKMQDMAQWRQILPADVDPIITMITEQLKGDVRESPEIRGGTNTQGNRQGQERGARTAKRNTRKRRYEYARAQEIYNKCPSRLVDWAIVGKAPEDKTKVEAPPKEEVAALYEDLWGVAGPQVKLKSRRRSRGNERGSIGTEEVWTPITREEIIAKFKKIKSNTAAGPDGVKKAHLRRDGALHIIAKLFNLLLMSRVYPEQWKLHRTTLIPKPGKSVEDVSNWRPITIGSIISRIYSAMIDRRIRSVANVNRRQKGFTKEDGCKQNISILSSALSTMKEKGGGVITVVDITKAFDTVPHSVMGSCLREKGIPDTAARYIGRMYDGCKTGITCKDGETVTMSLLRGVKQGDPLSPLLFNIVVDPIIGRIDETTEGIRMGDENVSILAFADDLVLLAKTKKEAAKQNKMLMNYLKELGMSVAASKCTAFQIVQSDKTWYMSDPKIEMGGSTIPYTDPEATVKYLGIKLDPWKGLRGSSIDEIVQAVKAVSTMKLKPHQKINLIRTYLLPRYIHRLVANSPPLGTLRQLDHEVKQTIKRILHLHPSTTDGVIYTAKSHGGLGVQRIENIVKLAKIRSATKMRTAEDEAVRQALLGQEGIIRKYAASMGLSWDAGVTMEQIEATRKALRKKETDRWRQLVSQGQGIKEFFGDRIGNEWLYNPKLLKPSRYLDALKLRTNTFGTKVALNRAKKTLDVQCRRCSAQAETLGHILGNCTHTKAHRIRRHNEICKLVKSKMPGHCAVFEEPTINVLGELRKPDLVIKDHDTVYVVDVTVRYEDRDNLPQAHREKERKYKDTAEYLRIKLNGVRAEVVPIVVGCRGAIPIATKQSMKVLGLGRKDCLTASLIALRSSIEIANEFLDYDHVS